MIYEALQKTQGEGETHVMLSTAEDVMTQDDWIDVSISLVIAFLLATLIVVHYPQFNTHSESISMKKNITTANLSAKSVVATTGPAQIKFQTGHMLNGVFVSGDEKVAMVDNRFFSIGDMIEDKMIVNIQPDHIKLKNNNGLFELRLAV